MSKMYLVVCVLLATVCGVQDGLAAGITMLLFLLIILPATCLVLGFMLVLMGFRCGERLLPRVVQDW